MFIVQLDCIYLITNKNSNILKYLAIYKLKERLSVICISLEPIQWI